jgi:hypothetical protein
MPYMIEGTWTGYRSDQERIVHRHYVSSKKQAERINKIGYSIWFADNTQLILCVTEVTRRKLPEIPGYTSLITDCSFYGVDSVNGLVAAQKKAKEESNDHVIR